MPSSPPESPKCDVLSSTSIYITWSPPPVESQNGKIRGYKVSYIAADDMYEQDPEIVKSMNQYLTIENLKKYTNYSVSVLAFTKVGDGIKTKLFFCTTHEDGMRKLISSLSFFLLHLVKLNRKIPFHNYFFFFIVVPSAPQNIKAIPASNTKIIVSWLPPVNPNGIIVSHNFLFQRRKTFSM